MFTRLLKPRWEHSDPRIRRQALESGSAPPEAVVKAARSDADPEVRQSAVACLEDLDLVTELTISEPVLDIREAADRRRRALLAGPLEHGPSLEARLAVIRRVPSAELCAFLVREAQMPEVRAAALEGIEDTELLATLAVDDPVATVRRAALERIHEPSAWERVARQARNKDKQVSRIARERLDAFQRARQARENAEQLCRSMEHLAEDTTTAATRAELHRLTRQWEPLQSPLPAPLQERFAKASQRVAKAVEQFESLLSQRRALCSELETLLASLQDHRTQQDGSTQPETERLADILQRWDALKVYVAAEDAVAERFADLVQQVRQESERLARDQTRAVKLQKVIESAAAVLDDQGELAERRVQELERRWADREPPESRPLREGLQQEFDKLLKALRERLKRQIRQRKEALAEAGRFLDELEPALQKGELEQALSLRDRTRHRLKTAKDVDESKRRALQRRLHALDPQLDTLRDWRHWGSGQSREELCQAMESLADAPLPATEIADRVRKAREAWKHIDRAEGPAAEALWQRFDAACTRAYAPYQEERRERMAQLEAHREQKEALCAELEALGRDTDWKTVDWSELDRRVRALRQRWRRIGPVPRKVTKSLERRFGAALEALEHHLGQERERELRRRRALIAKLETLVDEADPRAARREVKEAQKHWKPQVQAERKVEQALWRAFRAACDAVFKRIEAEREATERERQANLQRKQALCDELETLLQDAKADARTVTRRFAEASDEWPRIGPIPRKAEPRIAARYESLKKGFVQRQQREAEVAAERELEGLRERARLCERLETEVSAGDLSEADREALVQATSQAWEALPALRPDEEAPLRERLECARRALAGDAEARQTLENALAENLNRRLELCLQLEIETGIDSPAEFADTRMQLQVSRLEDALKHKQDDAGPDRFRALQVAWYQTGPPPEAERPGLEARFARALSAVHEQ